MKRPPFPQVICCGWKDEWGRPRNCMAPVIQPGEPGGRVIVAGPCAICLHLQKKAWRRKERWLEREARHRPRPEPQPDEVIFRGFREED